MLDQGYITPEQYDQVINDDVYSGIQAAQVLNSETENTVYSYFEDELIDQVVNDLMNIKGYTRTQAQNLVYSGGLSIYTTQDARIQSIPMKNMQIHPIIRIMYSMHWIMH